ncbi:MAG TPA: hypothetical protein VI078_04795 [bacterium]
MNPSLRGALLSGLVYPGLGQIAQKHHGRGIALIGVVSASLLVIVTTVVREVQAVLDKVAVGGGAYDLGSILAEVDRVSGGRSPTATKVATVAIVCCWVAGIVDAWVEGKKMEAGDRVESGRVR